MGKVEPRTKNDSELLTETWPPYWNTLPLKCYFNKTIYLLSDTGQNHNIFCKICPSPRSPFPPSLVFRCPEHKWEQLPGPHPTSSPTPSQSEFYPLTHSFPNVFIQQHSFIQYGPGTRLGAGPVEMKDSASPEEFTL